MRFLVTAGPTREPLDPVRYLSNRSSGKMGWAIAVAARDAGHEVVLISGPVSLTAPDGVRVVAVETAAQMFDAVHDNLEGIDIAVLAAAVADFTPAHVSESKIKKQDAPRTIELKPTRDILAAISRKPRALLVAGFAAETDALEKHALEKLRTKGCDVIFANDVRGGAVFGSDENAITAFFFDGTKIAFEQASKRDLAARLISILVQLKKNQKKTLT